MLDELEADMAEALAGEVTELAGVTTPSSFSGASAANVMGNNFVSASSDESRYLAASKQSHKIMAQVFNQQNSRLSGLLNSLVGVGASPPESLGTAAGAYLFLKRQIKDAEDLEASRRNLDEIKDNIDQKAREAAAPKDENGKPIEGAFIEDGRPPAPLPEVAEPAQPPPPDTAPAPEASAPAEALLNTALAAYAAVEQGSAPLYKITLTA